MRIIMAAIWFWVLAFSALAAELDVLYLKIKQAEIATLSNLDPIPEDLGQRGAELAITDNNTTGSFMGYRFALRYVEFDEGALDAALAEIVAATEIYVLLDANADQIAELAQSAAEKLFFNVAAYDDALRSENCQANLFHTLPSYAMRADALMQSFVQKRWDEIVLIEGAQAADAGFAEAIRRSAQKFGLKLKADETWIFDEDMRRHASAEVPLYTQQFDDYDAMVIADERNDFARYINYNTWNARPIFGADGLMAKGWSRVMEQWGAAQLQSRFEALASRDMQDKDYAAWAAIRAIDEAYIRTEFGAPAAIREYLVGDAFTLAGFKGRPLSFRNWNGQMRQPIGLVSATALVANAPLEGFLHATNELDSLGIDQAQSQCQNFGG